jgi:O-antigen ligase
MEHPDLAQLAAVGGAVGAVLVLLARGRLALLAGLVVLGAAELGLAYSLGTGSLDRISSATGVAAAVVGIVVLGGAAALLARRPAIVPVAVLVAAPFRPPLSFDSSGTFLVSIADDGRLGRLLPLYFVLAAAGAALGWRALRGREIRALPLVIAAPAAAFFAFACLSLTWAGDLEAGANLLAFFTLPFALLLATVARADFRDSVPRALGVAAIGLATLFALVGLWQAVTHELFFYAPNLAVSNANTDFFRVTSLFGDPSLYGRHLVLGIGVVLALLAARRWKPWPLVALLVIMWAGLFFSYSQSSMAALLVVTLALGLATGGRRVRLAVGVLALVALLAGGAYAAVQMIDGESLNKITSDRTERVEDTLRVVEEDPIVGVGIGGQPRASRRLAHSDRPTPNFVSHTTPLTVFAELGVVGLALYAWLLVGGALMIAAVRRHDEALGLALMASFLALFVHALFYSGFLEDPVTWLVLAVAAGYLTWHAVHDRHPTAAERARARREGIAPVRAEPGPSPETTSLRSGPSPAPRPRPESQ